jgi:hypothetical protein
MTELAEVKNNLTALHDRIEAILAGRSTEALQAARVTAEWNVLDAIGHINAWGLLFLDDIRFMAAHPGRPIPYQLFSTTNYDQENEALVARRRGWTRDQHLAENRQLREGLLQLIESFEASPPDAPVPPPWSPKPMTIVQYLRYHGEHGYDHLRDVLPALEP